MALSILSGLSSRPVWVLAVFLALSCEFTDAASPARSPSRKRSPSRSHSPQLRLRSKSHSPVMRSKSHSPVIKSKSRSPMGRTSPSRSRSMRRSASRSQSPHSPGLRSPSQSPSPFVGVQTTGINTVGSPQPTTNTSSGSNTALYGLLALLVIPLALLIGLAAWLLHRRSKAAKEMTAVPAPQYGMYPMAPGTPMAAYHPATGMGALTPGSTYGYMQPASGMGFSQPPMSYKMPGPIITGAPYFV